ncbi:MAG: hypothetical protein KDA87_02965 [Planctomycetales bacterium]|nr:hypothetical protein [Planctomycetales bacterium]
MSNPESFQLDNVDAANSGISVRFHWQHDRYVHQLVALQHGQIMDEWVSVDGDGQDLWPLSPPLQQVHFQEIAPGNRCLFAVGMAGASHWSMAVSADSDCLVFDVACRMKDAPNFLGSTYRLGAVEMGRHLDLHCQGLGSDGNVGDQLAQITTVLAADATFPVTVRWKYDVVRKTAGGGIGR